MKFIGTPDVSDATLMVVLVREIDPCEVLELLRVI
jgi:hypothetical protein